MYAVEKLSSYITRGVYTVSGPFHPFGGAVDIIVVQQQDGSFKSSPWYVRFGKFQGVLKTKEKIVTICVNGVEAGFHMYLDHKGEAYFLKESDTGEEDFVISSLSSGDEIDEKMQSMRFKKTASCNFPASPKKTASCNYPVSPRESGNGKIVTRTTSRRSRIFGYMFGRQRSMKESNKGVNVDRVSSLERAEIAANLLEMKWSTNLRAKDRRVVNFAEKRNVVENEMISSNVEVLDDNFGNSVVSQEHFEEKTIYSSQRLRSDMGIVGSDTSEIGELTDRTGLMYNETMVRVDEVEATQREPITQSPIADRSSLGLSNDNTCDKSISSFDNILINNSGASMVTEVCFEEEITYIDGVTHDPCLGIQEEILETYNLGTDYLVDNNEVSSNSAESPLPIKHLIDTECVSVSSIGCQEKNINSFGHRETLKISTVLDVSTDQVQGTLNLSNGGGGQIENYSEVQTTELIGCRDSQTETDEFACKEEHNECHSQDLFKGNSPSSGAFQDRTANDLNAESPFRSSSSTNLHLLRSEYEVIYQDIPSHELQKEVQTRTEPIEHMGDRSQLTEDIKASSFTPVPNKNSGLESICSSLDSFNSNECTQEVENLRGGVSIEESCPSIEVSIAQGESSPERLEDDQFLFGDIDGVVAKETKSEVSPNCMAAETDTDNELEHIDHEESFESSSEVSGTQTSPIAIPINMTRLEETELLGKSLPIIRSCIHDLDKSKLLHPLSCSLDSENCEHDMLKREISSSPKLEGDLEDNMKQNNCTFETVSTAVDVDNEHEQQGIPISPTVESPLCKHSPFEGMETDPAYKAFDVEKEQIFEPRGTIAVDGDEKNHRGDSSGAIVPSGGSWRFWPFTFKRSKTISTVPSASDSTNEVNGDAAPLRSQSMMGDRNMQKCNFVRKKVRSLTPSSEELASLNLKEGRNVITFSFSTAMLGQQQVDARIYLWKWNTRIVISDVDGTITKSDVLGQFMPMVGVDWSQTGVAHLFSAIKENGYQLLFLSARAISQAYLTRQFLFNLKQDGKALPDGPVVISPDGLFPSLYREVIRRAPHEFKIACLEDIRAIFPPDCNPFYAGFGNRDTDEMSYIKVGIPKGKIFIINPKGEVAVNRRVDTKSYTSLHALVHGMFPPMSSPEQEDYNSWNYWKLPLPDV